MWVLLALSGCGTHAPAFPCCQEEPGILLYTEVLEEPSERQVEIVQEALGLEDRERASRVAALAARNGRSSAFWGGLRDKSGEYREVQRLVHEAGQREVVAAVPYVLSRLEARSQAADCSLGFWQLGLGQAGAGPCVLRDRTEWRPGSGREQLMRDGACQVVECRRDPRVELEASTLAALDLVGEDGWEATWAEQVELAHAVHFLAACLVGPEATWCSEVAVPRADQRGQDERR